MAATTRIETIDRPVIQQLRHQITDALLALAADQGLQVDVGNASYEADGSRVTFKLTMSVAGAESKVAKDFRELAACIGMRPDDLGRTFKQGTRSFRIDGYRSKARKNTILVTEMLNGSEGKQFIMPDPKVADALDAVRNRQTGKVKS